MKYSKPKVVAQNATEGSYAAGCPSEQMGNDYVCRKCDSVRVRRFQPHLSPAEKAKTQFN